MVFDKMKNLQNRFRRVFNENYTLLMKVVYRITGREDLAEEIVQETMIKFYERIEQLPYDETIRYWLLRVARNLALNYEKRRQRENAINRKLIQDENTFDSETADTKLIKKFEKSLVQKALMDLPFNLRVVLVLKEYFKFSYEEIGQALGITEGNVKVRIHRARLALASRLKQGVLNG